jgi:hypothetical protein
VSIDSFSNRIRKQFGFEVYAPRMREALILEHGKKVSEILPGPETGDIEKERLELTASLENEFDRIKKYLADSTKAISQDDIDKLREIREELQTIAES